MKLIKNNESRWQEKEGYSKKILLEGVVQEIKIKAGETAKSHHHKVQKEIFYFLSDFGYWIVNGEQIKPKIGDCLIIEPMDKHTVINESEKDYIYLAFKINYAENDLYWD